jgi:hypothetical protein
MVAGPSGLNGNAYLDDDDRKVEENVVTQTLLGRIRMRVLWISSSFLGGYYNPDKWRVSSRDPRMVIGVCDD